MINENDVLTLALKYDKQFSLSMFMNYALIILVFVNGFTFDFSFNLNKLMTPRR